MYRQTHFNIPDRLSGMTSAQAYERIAPRWERSMLRLGYAEAYKTLLENNTIAVGPVLDVGCGTGLTGQALLECGDWTLHGWMPVRRCWIKLMRRRSTMN